MATMNLWDESYSVGNPEMDRQHRELLEQAAALPHAMAEINGQIGEIRSAVQAHFTSEETHMRAIGYPYLELHSEIHRELLASLDEIVAHPRTHAQVPFSLRDLLLDWFIGHILTQDHDYARFARVLCVRPQQAIFRS